MADVDGAAEPHDGVLGDVDGALDLLCGRRIVAEEVPGDARRAEVDAALGIGLVAGLLAHDELFVAEVKPYRPRNRLLQTTKDGVDHAPIDAVAQPRKAIERGHSAEAMKLCQAIDGPSHGHHRIGVPVHQVRSN